MEIYSSSEILPEWISAYYRTCASNQGSLDNFRELIDIAAAGNLSTDAHLATIAISQGATSVSCASDFSRFKSLRMTKLRPSGYTSKYI